MTRRGARTVDAPTLVIAADFAARHPGNFLRSQFAVADAVRERLGLHTMFVLPERARKRYWTSDIRDAGFGCEFLPRREPSRGRALFELSRRSDARIVHSHYTWFDIDALYAAKRTGAAVVWHVRNGLLDYPWTLRMSDVVKARVLGRLCDAVVAVSPAVGHDLHRRGFPPRAIRVVVNGLALDRFDAPTVPRHDTRAELGVDDDTTVVVAFCWPPVRKGTDIVVDAAARLGDVAPHRRFAFVLVGEPEPLAAFVDGRGQPSASILIRPTVDDVPSLLAAADVFVSAAREEGFSFAVGEAMAAALPVVGSDIPGTSHFWEAPAFIRYPVEDAEALAHALLDVASDPRRSDVGAANRSWAFEHLGLERFVDETVACYAAVLGRPTPSTRSTG